MSEELEEACEDLISYFELDTSTEWPMIRVYSEGEFVSGVVSDELYEILIRIKSTVRDTED
jgi:hypothetical protein